MREDNIKMELKRNRVREYMDQWRALVSSVMNSRGFKNRKFRDKLSDSELSR
jgi:hypothetical protein